MRRRRACAARWRASSSRAPSSIAIGVNRNQRGSEGIRRRPHLHERHLLGATRVGGAWTPRAVRFLDLGRHVDCTGSARRGCEQSDAHMAMMVLRQGARAKRRCLVVRSACARLGTARGRRLRRLALVREATARRAGPQARLRSQVSRAGRRRTPHLTPAHNERPHPAARPTLINHHQPPQNKLTPQICSA